MMKATQDELLEEEGDDISNNITQNDTAGQPSTQNIDLGEEGVISFGFDDDDDDDMADLFSFGAEPSNSAAGGATDDKTDYSAALASVMPVARTQDVDDDDCDGSDDRSEDSFLQMLEQQKESISLDTDDATKPKEVQMVDKDRQEILDWLEEDENVQDRHAELKESEFNPPTRPTVLPTPEKPKQIVPEFKTLEEAVMAPKASLLQIRRLLKAEKYTFKSTLRPYLWGHLICGKSLDSILSGPTVASFQRWDSKPAADKEFNSKLSDWVKERSKKLAGRIADVTKGDVKLCEEALVSILMYQCTVIAKSSIILDEDDPNSDVILDPLLPSVAATILSAGIPKDAAAAMLNQVTKKYLPMLRLNAVERDANSPAIQRQFYLLAVYHNPLLVFHLDRYFQKWYEWPSSGGFIPPSWLISFFCGEADGASMEPWKLIYTWDALLSSGNYSLHYFLVLDLLEASTEKLLLLTGEDLKAAFQKLASFQETPVDGFAIEAASSPKETIEWVQEWVQRALALWEATPLSVANPLKTSVNEVVATALEKRKEEQAERKQLRDEARAKAQEEAAEAEREARADEARLRLTRARLVAFYRQYNPGKENNIDKIMSNYEGRYEVLDAKLKAKYKVGFNPALKPKPTAKGSNTIFSGMNQGITARRGLFFSGKKRDEDFVVPENDKVKSAVTAVKAAEILPTICWSKKLNSRSLNKNESPDHEPEEIRVPLRYYLIDCRPEQASQDQGRFPTAVSLPPETFMDPDKLQIQEEMMEPLRGTVHIVIMGEGYKSLPALYGHKMTPDLHEYVKEDESRNNLCALFFVKKGFPFVSILDGGFAAAHAWLCREGTKKHLKVADVLTDYNSAVSLFGQFEALYQEQKALENASAKDKTQRTIQNLFDSSMIALTKGTKRFETLSSEVEVNDNPPAVQKSMVDTFFRQSKDSNIPQKSDAETEAKPEANQTQSDTTEAQAPKVAFRNPFAQRSLSRNMDKTESERSLEVESVEFPDEGDEQGAQKTKPPTEITSPNSGRKKPAGAFGMFGSSHSKQPSNSDEKNERENSAASNPAKASAFAGFGAVIKTTTIKTGAIQMNPFARFGKKSAGANQDDSGNTKNAPIANRFAGLNKFRKNTIALVRQGGKESTEETDTVVQPSAIGDVSTIDAKSEPTAATESPDPVIGKLTTGTRMEEVSSESKSEIEKTTKEAEVIEEVEATKEDPVEAPKQVNPVEEEAPTSLVIPVDTGAADDLPASDAKVQHQTEKTEPPSLTNNNLADNADTDTRLDTDVDTDTSKPENPTEEAEITEATETAVKDDLAESPKEQDLTNKASIALV